MAPYILQECLVGGSICVSLEQILQTLISHCRGVGQSQYVRRHLQTSLTWWVTSGTPLLLYYSCCFHFCFSSVHKHKDSFQTDVHTDPFSTPVCACAGPRLSRSPILLIILQTIFTQRPISQPCLLPDTVVFLGILLILSLIRGHA